MLYLTGETVKFPVIDNQGFPVIDTQGTPYLSLFLVGATLFVVALTLSLFGAESSWFVGVGIGVFIVLSCLVLAYVREFAYAGPADIPKFVGILTGSISITSLILSIFGMAIPSDITDIIVESIQIILALILLYFACKVDATGFYSEPFRTGWHIALICGCIGIYIAAMIFCAIL